VSPTPHSQPILVVISAQTHAQISRVYRIPTRTFQCQFFQSRYLILFSYTYIVSRDVRALMPDDLYTHLIALPNSLHDHQTESVLNVSRQPEKFTQHSLQQLLPPPNCTRNLAWFESTSSNMMPVAFESTQDCHKSSTSKTFHHMARCISLRSNTTSSAKQHNQRRDSRKKSACPSPSIL
jgi:hypothetical protein